MLFMVVYTRQSRDHTEEQVVWWGKDDEFEFDIEIRTHAEQRMK